MKFTELLLRLVVKTPACILPLSKSANVFPFTTSTRCNIDNPVSMGMLSVSVVSMVLKDTPAGLVLRLKHLIVIDVKVALNFIRTIKFGQLFPIRNSLYYFSPWVNDMFVLFVESLSSDIDCSLIYCELAETWWKTRLDPSRYKGLGILITKECFYME